MGGLGPARPHGSVIAGRVIDSPSIGGPRSPQTRGGHTGVTRGHKAMGPTAQGYRVGACRAHMRHGTKAPSVPVTRLPSGTPAAPASRTEVCLVTMQGLFHNRRRLIVAGVAATLMAGAAVATTVLAGANPLTAPPFPSDAALVSHGITLSKPTTAPPTTKAQALTAAYKEVQPWVQKLPTSAQFVLLSSPNIGAAPAVAVAGDATLRPPGSSAPSQKEGLAAARYAGIPVWEVTFQGWTNRGPAMAGSPLPPETHNMTMFIDAATDTELFMFGSG